LSVQGGFGMLRAMRVRPIGAWILGVSALAGSGCAYGEVRQVVRAQFASELDCPEVVVKRRDAWYGREGHQFKVTGCGVVRSYTCEQIDGRVSYDEPACTWVEGDIDAPKMMAPKPEEALPEEELPPLEEAPLEETPAEDPKPKSKAKPKLEDPTIDETGEPIDAAPTEPAEEGAGGGAAKPEAAPKSSASGQIGGGIKLGGTKKK